jgi:hypothetical protein
MFHFVTQSLQDPALSSSTVCKYIPHLVNMIRWNQSSYNQSAWYCILLRGWIGSIYFRRTANIILTSFRFYVVLKILLTADYSWVTHVNIQELRRHSLSVFLCPVYSQKILLSMTEQACYSGTPALFSSKMRFYGLVCFILIMLNFYSFC